MRRHTKLKRHGVKRAKLVIREAHRAHLPVADALAMLEQETGIPQANVFGGDCSYGACHYHERVTARKVQDLLGSPYSNGIGWTQVTYKPLIPDHLRHKMHRPKYQMRVGFKVLAGLIRTYGVQGGHQRYNGSGAAAEEYGRVAVELRRKWQNILG